MAEVRARCWQALRIVLEPQCLAFAAHRREGRRGKSARGAVAMLADLELGLARAQRGIAAPVQSARPLTCNGLPSLSTASAKDEQPPRLAGNIRLEAFAGLDPIPAACHGGLAVVDADRGHHAIRACRCTSSRARRSAIAAPPKASRRNSAAARSLRSIRGPQELAERGLRFRAVDPVDRRGVIAADQEQPLDRGEARLLVVIARILGEIGGVLPSSPCVGLISTKGTAVWPRWHVRAAATMKSPERRRAGCRCPAAAARSHRSAARGHAGRCARP